MDDMDMNEVMIFIQRKSCIATDISLLRQVTPISDSSPVPCPDPNPTSLSSYRKSYGHSSCAYIHSNAVLFPRVRQVQSKALFFPARFI